MPEDFDVLAGRMEDLHDRLLPEQGEEGLEEIQALDQGVDDQLLAHRCDLDEAELG